uniref:NADH-ubiquinone oxidoreductase chain 1 n=2 Tax=Aeluroscalabotes felinus TaxID=96749 RepID=A0A1Y1CCQ9_AELFE|nr:NADH dehydrogenase subunit 1 [Aeluroscalabotes felinus]BAX77923.1 NADH dehydrogenase subunit 1 [Aeluroscalabotes felinus]
MHQMIPKLMNSILLIMPILLSVAFLTLLERKFLGYMQHRKGPNIIGTFGLLQPIADGMKLFIKEPLRPTSSNMTLFLMAPIMALTLALMIWIPLPMPQALSEMNLGLLFMLALSSLMVYSILWSGWASNSKYALIGALRAIAQTISYEVSLGIIILSTVLSTGGFSLKMILLTQEQGPLMMSTWPLMMMWFISTLAETNRAPFDLTEGESELVSGFNTEYAGGLFALFFLAEYANILLMNTLSCILFLSQSTAYSNIFTLSLMIKTCLLTLGFLWVRASYPRFRYDQLMHLVWKNFLPLILALCLWYTMMPIMLAGTPSNM